MLAWVIIFLIIAIIAALFGFTGIAITAAEIAKILFLIFFVLFIASLIMYGTGINLAFLSWAIIFLIIAVVAAILGFSKVSAVSMNVAKIIIFIFIILFVVSLVLHLMGRG